MGGSLASWELDVKTLKTSGLYSTIHQKQKSSARVSQFLAFSRICNQEGSSRLGVLSVEVEAEHLAFWDLHFSSTGGGLA